MSMMGFVRQLTPEELADLRRNPGRIWELMHSENLDQFPPNVRPLMERMQALLLLGHRDSPEIAELQKQMDLQTRQPGALRALVIHHLTSRVKAMLGLTGRNELRLEKCWHALHFVLTGTSGHAPPPLGNAILGGQELGENLGYGPARFLEPEAVRDVAAALARISRGEFSRRYEVAAMRAADVYAFQGEERNRRQAHRCFKQLARYYSRAAGRGNAMLLYVR